MGIPLEELNKVVSAREGMVTDFEVMYENWEALTVFLRCVTQWRVSPMGGRLGLDYGAVRIVTDAMKLDLVDPLMWKVQQIERGALKELSKRA